MSDIQEIEKQIVHLLLHSRDAARQLMESPVRINHFTEKYKLLVEAVLDAESKNAQLTRKSFSAYLEKYRVGNLVRAANETNYADCYASVVGVKIDDLHALITKKHQHYVKSEAVRKLQEFGPKSEADAIFAVKELADSLQELTESNETAHQVTFNDIGSREHWDQWEREFQDKLTKELSVTDCGIPEIDDVMGVGFDPETMTIICADVGGFKSTLMLNIALNVWKRHKKDVLFIGLEMPKNRLMDKILSREARIPFKYFQRPKHVWTDEEQKKLQVAKQEIVSNDGGRFVLLEFNQRTTVSQIRRQIQKHLTHFQPALVVVDYIGNLEADASQRRRDRNDLEIGDMLKALLKMGKPGSLTKDGFGILTGAQTNRDALKRMKTYRGDASKFVFSSEDIQGSHQYSADATSIFCLYPDPTNKNRIFIFPVKNRYGEKTYKDGSNKAALDVHPEFNLIESPTNVIWKSNADDNILAKTIAPPKIFDDPWAEDDDVTNPSIEEEAPVARKKSSKEEEEELLR